MFEISSHKVTSISSIYTVAQRADIWLFGSTTGYNLTPHYRVLGSLHVREIFKKRAAENRGEILLIMIQPMYKTGSPSCGT